MKIKVKPEGRKDIWLPEKKSLKEFILSKKFETIHNFIDGGMIRLGADHGVKSVLRDIDNAERLAIFTNERVNMGHSLAIIKNNELNGYEIGVITKKELLILKD